MVDQVPVDEFLEIILFVFIHVEVLAVEVK